MSTQQTPRPWFIPTGLIDDYKRGLTTGGELQMLKTLKIVRAIIVNVGLAAVALYALFLGAEPTLIGALGLIVFAGYNGLEYADLRALAQAYSEIASGGDSSE
ncbi:hypothetical protein Hbl1158_02960 [Halobaculum sp. CBA1158]|uniref:hypothetical protein n=1 Tax=Halobaculum sp. CBA1158 TaxID=2904243 RepID=UPI001F347A1D|nr:hypothetical protein [Halobaculum sp. CBA1158]UIP00347.1 hypothetical protein Hbl1158_02960 [Halobaculum sp. CBA1158]